MPFEIADHRRGTIGAAAALVVGVCLTGCASGIGEKGGTPSLVLSQAHFSRTIGPAGKPEMSPLPSRLVVLRELKGRWVPELIDDPDSNVFHKAVFIQEGNGLGLPPGILSIGGNKAALKAWRREGKGWVAHTLWQPTFGGGNDRLRDFEIGDVTGDGRPDIVVGTHDQGVVAVLTGAGDTWSAQEIDRRPNTFVHEVELGDLDQDGVLEIYATPSEPNRFDGTSQVGEIVAYRFAGGSFQRSVVETFGTRTVKELLVTTIDGDGAPSLLAAAEADLSTKHDDETVEGKTLVRRYRFRDGRYAGDTVFVIPDRLCRFLNAGDVDGDGKIEIVASTHCQGVWVLQPGPGEWTSEIVDPDSSGFEHATALADLDGDGVLEIYVAADKQLEIRRHRFEDGRWLHETLHKVQPLRINFFIDAARF